MADWKIPMNHLQLNFGFALPRLMWLAQKQILAAPIKKKKRTQAMKSRFVLAQARTAHVTL